MESEDFKQSIPMLNIIYNRLIGNRDSTVTKKLFMSKLYKPDCLVKKIECKNYMNRISDICKKKKEFI